MKISLCMITGNEEAVILRCLESAKTAFDELCLVSAVGSLPADKTLYLAEKWCAENGKEFKGDHYRNSFDLPHVDDFGAARNLSFSLATGDWILWLDCDDYMDDINCARIRDIFESGAASDANGVFTEYVIEKNGAIILRERLIRRGFGRWKNAIHEICIIEGKQVECPKIQIYHGDHRPKHSSSAARNAEILRRTVEDAARHFFYLHCELRTLKDPEATKYGRIVLAMDEMDPEQKYAVLLNMSELEPDKCERHLHEAARIQPHRREAFGYLCKSALIDGRLSDAKSYFRLMDALPLPSPVPWTHQGMWYGWARNALKISILNACGQSELAAQEHAKYMQDADYAENIGDWK